MSTKVIENSSSSSSLSVPLLSDEQGYAKEENSNLIAVSHSLLTTTANVSLSRTCFNVLNAIAGVGMLSVPYALASGGWLRITLLFAVAMVAFYSSILIKRCLDYNPNIRTYPDIGEQAFGKFGRIIVSVSMYLELYLCSTTLLIIEGDHLNDLFPNFGLGIISGKQLFVVLVAIIILPTVLLDDMSFLSYVSASGIFASLVIILSVLWVATIDGVGFHEKRDLLNWNGIPTAVSLYAVCYGGLPVFPTLYTSMANKQHFSKVLLVSFMLATIGNASIAIIGYLMFGPNTKSQVTLNLPIDEISSKIAVYTTVVNPITKYALFTTPITNALKDLLPTKYKNRRVFHMLISTLMLISNVIITLTVPLFGDVMSLIGAFLIVTSCILLPCLCYLKISGNYCKLGFETIAIAVIIVGAAAVGISGTCASLIDIPHLQQHNLLQAHPWSISISVPSSFAPALLRLTLAGEAFLLTLHQCFVDASAMMLLCRWNCYRDSEIVETPTRLSDAIASSAIT
ncbi:hypothetical protein PIB30_076477 [Stylosanthes scabra]|uniref:Amino acid transporter transmembrane domain-containing protein n=1 Tax=Stylosanthes scabra TaxID=79078 RepID=A0ABU6VNP1_9FABA|nr:hypothetical protein [Stylosanthes scabra]